MPTDDVIKYIKKRPKTPKNQEKIGEVMDLCAVSIEEPKYQLEANSWDFYIAPR